MNACTRLGSCFRECSSHRLQLTKLVIARPTERSDVIRHRQSAVDHDTKVTYAVNDTDRRRQHWDTPDVDSVDLVLVPQPNRLSLGRTETQPTRTHPIANVRHAPSQAIDSLCDIVDRRRHTNLQSYLVVYSTNSWGPRTDPCGTLNCTGLCVGGLLHLLHQAESIM